VPPVVRHGVGDNWGRHRIVPSEGAGAARPHNHKHCETFRRHKWRRIEFAYDIVVVCAPALRSWATARTSCAGAKGLVSSMLCGTPFDGHSSAASPVM
jgi:hypothetical protein